MGQLKRLFKEEEGQALTEYGLLIGLISIGVVAVLALIGPQLVRIFNTILTRLTAV
ncbi:Flp family type IVb pilin [Paenisporosarcina sp. NPDC076898]|uniref:Flp family type IVb pilin n=1 Tax=unclassified Paenisporosarcina TaxID=2642018 RepID=UPI003CFE29B8